MSISLLPYLYIYSGDLYYSGKRRKVNNENRRAKREERAPKEEMVRMVIDIPGYKKLDLDYLILDYNGTIAIDGLVPEDMRERFKKLAEKFKIYVVTADTHGNAKAECSALPVEIRTFPSADAAYAKKEIVEKLGAERCVCVGNGRNDVLMCRIAGLSVAVMDVEGMYGGLAAEADICVRSMQEGMDLLMSEKRLIATLRG